MSLNRDFFKSINYKIISKLSEKLSTSSEIIGVNFIKIGPAMTSGYLFEKNVVLYEIYRKFFEWEQIYGA